MRFTSTPAALLLHLAVTPCAAESSPRSPLDSLNISSHNASLASPPSDPPLPIPPHLPFDVDLADGGTAIRITDYHAPFVSSFNILPCLVEMLTTAFTGVAGAGEQKLPYNQFVCQRNGVELRFVGNQITPPLVYGDLVRLACLLLRFQQMYVMPGVGFFYLEGRRVRGQGHLYVLFVGDESGQGVGVE